MVAVEALVIAALATGAVVRLDYEFRPRGPRQDVVVILVDALRASHIGAYGHDVPTSPFFDRLAARGTLFENVRSQSTWTKPSVASLFTSLYPCQHRVSREPKGQEASPTAPLPSRGTLPEELLTLAEVFHADGYRTVAFMTNVWLAPGAGYERGFDDYLDLSYLTEPQSDGRLYRVPNLPAAHVHARLKEYLSELRAPTLGRRVLARLGLQPKPLFIYVHYMDVHGPYAAPWPFRDMFDATYRGRPDRTLREDEISAFALQAERSPSLNHYRSRYDAQIRYLDTELEDLFSWLASAPVLREPLVAITSDHGEAFGEHQHFMHGGLPYEEVVRIPLLVLGARNAPVGRRVHQPVQLIDLGPTLLDLVGLEVPGVFEGLSLKPLIQGQPTSTEPVWSDILNHERPTLALIENETAWLYDRLTGSVTEVYDLRRDPEEQTNLLATLSPEVIRTQSDRMRTWLEHETRRVTVEADMPEPELSPEARRRLEQLGYLK